MFVSSKAALAGYYDYGEVARSVFIAMAASYAALDLTGRVTAARGRIRLAWLSGGAVAMGLGIWAMHFKGMLAFHLPVPVEYHWPTVLASLLVAIFASAFGLYVASRQKMGWREALTGSVIMGAGIAGLHYISMAAMRLPAITRYSPLLVTASILLAVLFCLIALLMAFDLREETRWTVPRRLGSAIVMGAAVSAMHYTGMAAANFIPAPPPDLTHAVNISALGNDAIGVVTLIVLAAAMVTSSVDWRTAVEVQRLNQALERRVAERTSELEAVNQALRNEVAERERAEESVRASEDRLRLVIDTAPAMLHSARPDGYIDFFNKRWLEYVGVSLEDIRGWQWTHVIHSEDVAHVLGKWRSSLATGKPFEAEARLRRADGEYRLMLLRKVPLRDEAENIVKWYGSATDIEDRRRAEEQLRQAQEDLARVTRVAAMGELAAIAHEVNQPLTAIVTNASLSLRQLNSATPDAEELRGAITEIVSDGARASAVLSRIRALLVSGAPSATEVDINQVIQDVILLLRYELNRNRISLRTEPAPELPPVRGDPVQLQQVLINLIMNAIDALRKSGDRPREILIRSDKNPEGILVQVEDSGPGIRPEQADRIFEPFFTTKPQGMGMGLSISRSIVESHGGRLWAAPGELHGARFQFIVPMADISNE